MLEQLQSLGITPLIGASAIAGITLVFSLWDKTSGIFTKLFSFIIVPVNFKNDNGATENAFVTFINHKMKAYKFNVPLYEFGRFYVRPKKMDELIILKQISDGTSLYWYGKIPVLVTYSNNGGSHGSFDATDGLVGKTSSGKSSSIGFKYIRGTLDEEQFLLDILNYYNNEYLVADQTTPLYTIQVNTFTGTSGTRGDSNKTQEIEINNDYGNDFRRYITIPYSKNELGKPFRPIEKSVYLTKTLKEIMVETFNWLSLKEWYLDKQIPWKRSYLLTGKPGTGKTLFVRTVAESLRADIYTFDLATMNNEEFKRYWKSAHRKQYRVILLEDIDAVFDGRTNITSTAMNKGLTFDCLLQAIDGIERGDGTLLFITTNYPEKLDPAISGGNAIPGEITTRPGRVDRVIEFKELELEGSQVIVNNILGDSDLTKDELEKLSLDGVGRTPGQLQEVCTRIALDRKWNATT